MQDPTEEGAFPDYDSPPVVETILGVQFERLPDFRNAHLGAFWKTLDTEEWPAVSDAPRLQPQFEGFTESARWARGAQFSLSQDLSSRLQIRNNDGDRMIQVQNDRLHFNWLGHAGDKKYPRYEKVREGFVWALQRLMEFVAEEKLGDFRPNQWEVTYLNHIPKGTVWNTPDDWGFFRPLGLAPPVEGLVWSESFGGTWHFVIPEQRGRLHVQWQHGKKSEADEQEMIVLTFTARGPVGENADALKAVLDGSNLGHETIVRSFATFMDKAANDYWGLKND